MADEIDRLQFSFRDFEAGRIGVGIELAAHLQSGVGGRRSDQFDDDLVTDQRLAAPVGRGRRERLACR